MAKKTLVKRGVGLPGGQQTSGAIFKETILEKGVREEIGAISGGERKKERGPLRKKALQSGGGIKVLRGRTCLTEGGTWCRKETVGHRGSDEAFRKEPKVGKKR